MKVISNLPANKINSSERLSNEKSAVFEAEARDSPANKKTSSLAQDEMIKFDNIN